MGSPRSRVAQVRVSGPLVPFVAGFRAWLEQAGYTPLSSVVQVRLLSRRGPGGLMKLRVEEVARTDRQYDPCRPGRNLVMSFYDGQQLVDRREVEGVGSRLDGFPVDGQPDQIRLGRVEKGGQVLGGRPACPLREERAVAEADERCRLGGRRPRLAAQQQSHGRENHQSPQPSLTPKHAPNKFDNARIRALTCRCYEPRLRTGWDRVGS